MTVRAAAKYPPSPDRPAPPPGYTAATEGVAWIDRSRRGRFALSGAAPGRMLSGIVTSRIPDPPEEEGEVRSGEGVYSAVLTPKGKMVSDLRLFRDGAGEEGALSLEVPEAGIEGLVTHLRKYLPPRFATLIDRGEETGMLTLVGPGAAGLLARDALGLRVEPVRLQTLSEDRWLEVGVAGGDRVRVVRTGEVAAPAFDVLASRGAIGALARRLEELEHELLSEEGWEALRVEAGRPAFGVEMDEGTIPIEAGIDRRVVDHGKGCYTGQEVIVRIRDRGHVNRYLRRLDFGDGDPPGAGAPLHLPDEEKSVGEVRSAVRSPRWGRTIGLGYLRREVEPPARVAVGGPEGPLGEAEVAALE